MTPAVPAPNRFLLVLANLPTTALRITVTILIIAATAVRYLVWGVPHIQLGDPGWSAWLFFLATLSGIDGAVYTAKRITWKPSPAVDPGAPDVEDASAGATVPPSTPTG